MLTVTGHFDVEAMQRFMRLPDIYWPAQDALAPPPEAVNFAEYMTLPTVRTVAARYGEHIVGFVQVTQRTSIGGELHCAFHPQARGMIARAVVQHAVALAFTQWGYLKLWSPIASNNRPALYGARHLGFREEGRLVRAIARGESQWGPAGLYDLVIMTLDKTGGH